MKHIPGAIIAVFIFAWMTFLGTQLINGQQAEEAADSYTADICKEISESNFAPSVIDACGAQAKSNDYIMTIKLYDENGSVNTYTYTSATNLAAAGEYTMAAIQMEYTYKIPILNISKTHTVRNIVR